MNAARTSTSPSRAFSLIEVLLAVTVFAIVLSAVHLVFYSAIRLRNKTTAVLSNAVTLDQTLAILKRDLANIVVPGSNLFGPLQTMLSSTNQLGQGVGLPRDVTGLPGRTSPFFYTSVGIIDDTLPWGEVQRVLYYLASPTNQTRGFDLIRSVTRNLLPTFNEDSEEQWLMGGVERIDFLYHDGVYWRDYWDSTVESTPLPQAIKLELQLVAEDDTRALPAPIEMVVPFFTFANTNAEITSQATNTTTGSTE